VTDARYASLTGYVSVRPPACRGWQNAGRQAQAARLPELQPKTRIPNLDVAGLQSASTEGRLIPAASITPKRNHEAAKACGEPG
jgi:hypothetical protein